ncbi:MAG: hypothetical protein SVU69_08070 [Pseudomonadota bacterium]|nr:hypothetical protein [Pseudomonadota bacterium]
MFESRSFWIAQGAGIIAFHMAAIAVMAITGQWFAHPLGMLWLIILVIHVLEIGVAFLALKDKDVPPMTLIAKTLVFGFIWWIPRRMGVYQS